MLKIQIAFALALALTTPAALAQGEAPDALLKAVTADVIVLIRQDKDIQAGNPAKVAEVVETRILPLFDFTRMTQLAVARNWRVASTEQRTSLTAEFRTLLVRTYSTALSSYRDQIIEFKPLRMAPGDAEVTVKSVVKQPGIDPLTIDYDMARTASGWKVYDIKIDGISLITTYRETFSEKVRSEGVDGLIKSLADKNRQRDMRRVHHTGNLHFPALVRSLLQGGT